jgi:hypothetical protein
LNNAKENINQDSKGNVTMKQSICLNFMGITKILMVKKTTIVPEDEEINFEL